MTEKTLQVTAQLYPVAVDLHAKPGDRLMVVAGVVVGIYTGEQRQSAAPKAPAPAAEVTPARSAKPAKGRKPAAKPADTAERRAHYRGEVARILREKGTAHATRLLDLFPGIRGTAEHGYLKATLRGMVVRGEILSSGVGPNCVYSLPEPAGEGAHVAA